MPDYLNSVPGQESARSVLSNLLLADKIPHALLFTGIEGCGKEYAALRFILQLNAAAYHDIRQLESKITSFSEPFVKYIFPLPRGRNETDESGPYEKLNSDEMEIIKTEILKKGKNPYYQMMIPKANNIKINSIRDIKKFLSMNYDDIKYRVVLISKAHLMNETAQNALLKNLEEPPEGVIFILVTHLPEQLRETIRSRCWVVNFHPLKPEILKKILISDFGVSEKDAGLVVPFAAGSVQTALGLLNENIEALIDKTIHILRYSFGKKYNLALNEMNDLYENKDTVQFKLLINLILIWFNDLQKYSTGLTDFAFETEKQTLEKFYSKFPKVDLKGIIFRLDKLSSLIQNNIALNLLIANLIFELASVTTIVKTSE
ncbi:MAG: AAA family ATPase [Ignavibacteriaceae bacterium]